MKPGDLVRYVEVDDEGRAMPPWPDEQFMVFLGLVEEPPLPLSGYARVMCADGKIFTYSMNELELIDEDRQE
jgi:hypothetical protein